jgi:hypothetical protein
VSACRPYSPAAAALLVGALAPLLLAPAASGGDTRARSVLLELYALDSRLDASRERLHAAVDGEPIVLEAPLELAIRPRALQVLVPRRADQGAGFGSGARRTRSRDRVSSAARRQWERRQNCGRKGGTHDCGADQAEASELPGS